MVDERKNFFLSLDVSIEIGSKDSFFPDGFEGIKLIFPIFFDKIDLTKSSFSDSLIELEAAKSNILNFMLFFDKLIQFKYIFLPHC